MKHLVSISCNKLMLLFCIICLNHTYAQTENTADKTVFGKTVSTKNGYIRCATNEYEQYLQEKDPNRMSDTQFEAWINPLVSKYKASKSSSKTAGVVITIPVVVHVIHSGQAVGTAPNITDNQVISQITVLNQDYRKLLNSPGYNTNAVGADVEIQFVLAQQDPNGNPTNGIDRVSLCQASWGETDLNTTVKPATIWDPLLYLNLWSVKFTDNQLLGYAQFPDNSGLSGVSTTNGTANSDGVVLSYDVFGSKTYNDGTFLLGAPYDTGRTMTHEIGHWLGLRHIWGDATCGTDYCADTPTHHDANYGCPTTIPLSCDTPAVSEMVQNYMDYTDDSCMNIFTTEQKNRMLTVMNNSPRRKDLKTSTKGTAIPLFTYDGEVKLEPSCPVSVCGGVTNQTTKTIVLYNRGTATLTSAKLNYSIDSGTAVEYNWTGSLATNKYATFNITINSSSNGTFVVNVINVNGVSDQRSSNNTATGTFIIPTSPTNYTFTTFKFTLQQDFFGSETTWNIKDGSGVTKYSGGPYTDTYVDDNTLSVLPALITQTWTLANNQCYTFTINDSSGDGICCGSGLGDPGNGYYSLKSTDETITIKSGASFTSSESIAFSTNTLGISEVVASNDIFLYPNPTKNILNIRVSSDFGLPNYFAIYNNLGQIISQKNVLSEEDLSINTSPLSNGIYYISIEKEGQKKSLPFIKE